MNSRVRITLDWNSPEGKPSHLETVTRIVSPYGCLVVLPHNLPLETKLTLSNVDRQQTLPAMVVWKGTERQEGWEHGLELENPELDFWGLEL